MKKCPICGKFPEPTDPGENNHWYVMCCGIDIDICRTKQNAILAWNSQVELFVAFHAELTKNP